MQLAEAPAPLQITMLTTCDQPQRVQKVVGVWHVSHCECTLLAKLTGRAVQPLIRTRLSLCLQKNIVLHKTQMVPLTVSISAAATSSSLSNPYSAADAHDSPSCHCTLRLVTTFLRPSLWRSCPCLLSFFTTGKKYPGEGSPGGQAPYPRTHKRWVRLEPHHKLS
jgi:hypothetical protein